MTSTDADLPAPGDPGPGSPATLQPRNPPTRPSGGAQRRAEATRSMIIDEAVACVVEEGAAAASARRIAERAGLTWGVVQYHFGDRTGLLGAVVTTGFEAFRASVEDVAIPARPTRARVEAVVDAAWAAFDSDASRAALEILVVTRPSRGAHVPRELVDMARVMYRLGGLLISVDPDRSPTAAQQQRAEALGSVLWATLRGCVLAQMTVGRPLDWSVERATLVDLLARHLDASDADGSADVGQGGQFGVETAVDPSS